jgi:enamine deaminase RidA (YjgF/YER057c/UK114 family)
MTITHLNPPTLHRNPAFSQATLVEGGRTLYVGGQNGTDATGTIVPGGAKPQALRALENVKAILAEAGGDQTDVAKLTVYYHREASLPEIFAAAGEAWGDHPTAITVLQVHALARPDALVEVEAIANL